MRENKRFIEVRARGAGSRKGPVSHAGPDAGPVTRRSTGVVGVAGRSVSLTPATLIAMLAMLAGLVMASAAQADSVPVSASVVQVNQDKGTDPVNGYVNCGSDVYIQFSAVQDVTSYHAEIDDNAYQGHRTFDGPPFSDSGGYGTTTPAPAGTHRFFLTGGASTGPPPCKFSDQISGRFSNLVVTGKRPTRTTTTTSASASPSASRPGQPVKYSATVSATSGSATPTGTVDFTVRSTVLCTAQLAAGVASCTATNAPVGNNTVQATYPGEGAFAGSSGTTTETVSATMVSGTVLTQGGQPVPGAQIDVSDASGVQATGMTDGTGSYQTGPLAPGSYTVTPHNNPEQYSPYPQYVTIDKSSATANFTHNLHLDQLSPTTGSPAGGQQITLTGYGFGPAGGTAEVRFDSTRFATTATDVQVLSDTQIIATIPREDRQKGDPDQAPVTVAIGGARSNAVDFTYATHVESISPNVGSPAGGTKITITGSGFGPAGNNGVQVMFNYVPEYSPNGAVAPGDHTPLPATDVHVDSNTKLFATVPADSFDVHGTVDVSVNVNQYRSDTKPFTYRVKIKSISPASASPAGGQRIDILGEGFGPPRSYSYNRNNNDVRVSFSASDPNYFSGPGGSRFTVETLDAKVVSDTQMTATLPTVYSKIFVGTVRGFSMERGAALAQLDVGHGSSNSLPFLFQTVLTSVSPNRASRDGGPVTIFGRGFGPAGNHRVRVHFDQSGESLTGPVSQVGQPTDVQVISDTQITARMPADPGHGTGGKEELYVTVGGDEGRGTYGINADNSLPFTYNRARSRGGKPKIRGRTASVSSDAVAVKISCTGTGSCGGAAKISAVGAQAASITRGRSRTTLIASGRYSIAAGKSATVRFALTRAGRRLLRKHHRTLRTTLKITPTSGKSFTQSLILRQTKMRKRR